MISTTLLLIAVGLFAGVAGAILLGWRDYYHPHFNPSNGTRY